MGNANRRVNEGRRMDPGECLCGGGGLHSSDVARLTSSGCSSPVTFMFLVLRKGHTHTEQIESGNGPRTPSTPAPASSNPSEGNEMSNKISLELKAIFQWEFESFEAPTATAKRILICLSCMSTGPTMTGRNGPIFIIAVNKQSP